MRAPIATLAGRVGAVTILLGLLAGAWILVGSPLITAVTDRWSDVEASSDQLLHVQAILERLPMLSRRDAAARANLTSEGGVWANASEAAIATAMQDSLRQTVVRGKGVVKSTAQLRGVPEGGLQRVRVRLSVEGSLDMIVATLAALQAARPAIFVDSLSISAPPNGTTLDKPPAMSLDLEISGYMTESQE